MLVGCVVEGDTEYYCLPSLLGRLGHTPLRPLITYGSSGDWETLIRGRVAPRVKALALKSPEKIIVVLDREDRQECPAALAARALEALRQELAGLKVPPLAIVIADRCFECILFADYEALDSIPVFEGAPSALLGETTDGKNVLSVLKRTLKPGRRYRKSEHGLALARRMNLRSPAVAGRSRALRKLLREAPPYEPEEFLF